MSLRIIEPTEVVKVEHPIFLIFGQPGVGKSSLGFSAANAVLLNFDTESAIARAVNRGRSINVLSIEELTELEKDTSILDPFDTVVIDPVGSCVNLMAAAIIDGSPRLGRDGNLTQQGWGVLKTRFRNWMVALRSRKKDLLLIAHHKEDKGSNDNVFVRPDITGGSKDEVMRLADFVGFLYMQNKDRILDFNPTEAWFGKNPAQWKPFRVPSPEKARTFMAQLFNEGRAALSKASEASASVANQVDDWRAEIQTLKTADEFNACKDKVRAIKDANVQAQAAKLLIDEAPKKKIVFDPATKAFAEKPEPATAGAGGLF